MHSQVGISQTPGENSFFTSKTLANLDISKILLKNPNKHSNNLQFPIPNIGMSRHHSSHIFQNFIFLHLLLQSWKYSNYNEGHINVVQKSNFMKRTVFGQKHPSFSIYKVMYLKKHTQRSSWLAKISTAGPI